MIIKNWQPNAQDAKVNICLFHHPAEAAMAENKVQFNTMGVRPIQLTDRTPLVSGLYSCSIDKNSLFMGKYRKM